MANKKFSEFVLKTSTSDVSHIVGYNGAENVQITPANFVTGGGTGVFLPLAGGTMTGNTTHNDNVKSIYGTSGDGLQIYHDGSDSYIVDSGTGGLNLLANADFAVKSYGTDEPFISAATNAFVKLFFDGSEKLATTSAGISVTSEAVVGNGTNGLQFSHSTSNSSGIINTGFSSTAVEIRTGNVQRMLINSTGATFAGSVKINSNNTLSLKNLDNTNEFQLFNEGATGANNANLVFLAGNVGERMRLDSSGNLGIGTSNPAYKLHLLNSSGDTEMYINGQNGESSLRMGLDVRNWQIKTAAAPYLWSLSYVGTDFQTSNILTATTSGNVGIGTSAPEAIFNLSQANGANIRFDNPTTSKYFTIGEGVGSSNKFSFRGNSFQNTDTLTVDFENDRVGVGAINPSQPFVVKDGIAVTGATSEAASITGDYILAVGKNTGDKSLHTQGDILCDGGIFLGGTVAANKLDDYEEGTFTPQIFYQNTSDQANVSYTRQDGFYTKVGNLVTIKIHIDFSQANNPATDNIGFANLPFTGIGTGGATLFYVKGQTQPYIQIAPNLNASIALFFNYNYTGNQGVTVGTGSKSIRTSFSYMTNQ